MKSLYHYLTEIAGYTETIAGETELRVYTGLPIPDDMRQEVINYYNYCLKEEKEQA